MIEHLGINTPYFGILVSIPFVIATYFYKTNGFFLLAPLFVVWLQVLLFEIDRN